MIFPHRKVSGVRSVGFSFLVLPFLLGLSGCYKDAVHEIGALELTEHLRTHLNLSCSMGQDLRGVTLCVRATGRCISDIGLKIHPSEEFTVDPFIAVTSDNNKS